MSRKDRKFKRFFRQKLGDLQKKKKKKKKKVFAKIQSGFSAEIQNSNVFFAQNQVISKKKKKKKKKVFAKIQSDFSAEIQNSNVFFAQNQVISKKKKKKKRSSPKFKAIFLPKFRNFKRFRGGSFRMGGAIFNFSQKIGLKSTKNMRFCILHKPMGGLEPPPPPPWLRYWVWCFYPSPSCVQILAFFCSAVCKFYYWYDANRWEKETSYTRALAKFQSNAH